MSMTNFLHSWVEHEETFCSLTTLLICCDGCVVFFFFFFFFLGGGGGVHIGSFVDAGLIFLRFLVKAST